MGIPIDPRVARSQTMGIPVDWAAVPVNPQGPRPPANGDVGGGGCGRKGGSYKGYGFRYRPANAPYM